MKLNTVNYFLLLGITCFGLVACEQRTTETTGQSTTTSTPPSSGMSTSSDTAAGGPGSGMVTADPAASSQPLNETDKQFFMAAAQSGYAEVAASQMAKERASNSQIKDFANMMVTEHTAADRELKALAAQKNLQLPENDAGKYKADIDALTKLNGAAFDRAYVQRVGVTAHTEAVSLFENAANNASDPAVKALAVNLLPTLKRHLEMAQKLPKA